MLFQTSTYKVALSIFRQFTEMADFFLILESSLFSEILAFYPGLPLSKQSHIFSFRLWSVNKVKIKMRNYYTLSVTYFPCKKHFILLEIRTEWEPLPLTSRNETHKNSSVLTVFTSHWFEKNLAKISRAHSECSNNSLQK